jgi:2,4-dienoyl-CoA reductase-like NADH-dependent reductase (Old Yellow Enzyme family)/NADPH-dependent 2,4-dienoyl-CoA reductase/sulfur reductase-like enzyme
MRLFVKVANNLMQDNNADIDNSDIRSSAMGKYDHVLSPFTFGPVTVKNRIELSPACYMLASHDGYVTQAMVDYYENLARGGAGIITIGESPLDWGYSRGHEFQINTGDKLNINGLSRINEAVTRFGAKLSIELEHPGRYTLNGNDTIGPSPIVAKTEELNALKEGRKRIKVTPMDQDLIDFVIEEFAISAHNCQRAGLEMVMIHGAHGQLISQFLSPHANKRTDAYGGSLENRARFGIEVLTAIRKKCGAGLGIEYRISADELIPDGMRAEEVLEYVRMIEDKIDLLHVSVGILGYPKTVPHIIQPTYLPHCYNVHWAERFKKELKIPITTVGSIMTMEEADEIIASDRADIVAMARAILVDPQIVNNARHGRSEDTRPCLRCHTCNKRTAAFYPIRCAVNPILGRETQYAKIGKADIAKKVVIIGGGPAGMQAAITASRRGHQVVLFERGPNLGGNLLVAAGLELKHDMRRYLGWLVRETENSPNIAIRMNTEATRELAAAENPDAVIIAIGADPIIPAIKGEELNNVVWVGKINTREAEAGKRVLIAGGGATGAEAALQLAKDGKSVTVIDMLDENALLADWPRGLSDQLEENGITLMCNTKLAEVTSAGAVVEDNRWQKYDIEADTIIISFGFRARLDAVSELSGIVPDTFTAGDCKKPDIIMQAIHDGFNIAVEL